MPFLSIDHMTELVLVLMIDINQVTTSLNTELQPAIIVSYRTDSGYNSHISVTGAQDRRIQLTKEPCGEKSCRFHTFQDLCRENFIKSFGGISITFCLFM